MICLRQRFQKPDIGQDRHGQAQRRALLKLDREAYALVLLI